MSRWDCLFIIPQIIILSRIIIWGIMCGMSVLNVNLTLLKNPSSHTLFSGYSMKLQMQYFCLHYVVDDVKVGQLRGI